MSKYHKLMLCPALAMAGIVAAASVGAVASNCADESASRPAQPAITELQAQNNAPHKELGNSAGNKQPASAASSDKANSSSASSTETKAKKKNKKNDQAKPAPSDDEEQFKRALLGIYG